MNLTSIPDDARLEIYFHSAEGLFTAYFYADSASRVFDGTGQGETVEEACAAAVQDAA